MPSWWVDRIFFRPALPDGGRDLEADVNRGEWLAGLAGCLVQTGKYLARLTSCGCPPRPA